MQVEQDLCFGPHRLDLKAGQLWRDQEQVKLTPKALAVLRVLVVKAGQVVTKEELFQTVWPQTVVSDDALTTCILELRHALRDNAKQPTYIEAVHRRGYRFLPPVTTQPVPGAKLQVASSESRSQNPEVSGQEEVVSIQQQERQKVKGENGLEPSVQSPEPGADTGQTRDPRRQTLDASAPTRTWPGKGLVLAAVLLLVGTVLTIHYLLRPTLITHHSLLRRRSLRPCRCPTNLPSPLCHSPIWAMTRSRSILATA